MLTLNLDVDVLNSLWVSNLELYQDKRNYYENKSRRNDDGSCDNCHQNNLRVASDENSQHGGKI